MGTPLHKVSPLGRNGPDEGDTGMAELTMEGMEHSDAAGCLASLEGPAIMA